MIPSWASCHLLLPISASSAVKLADLSTYHPVQICPTTSDLTVTKNGALFFTDHYTNGADWQGIINSFAYNQGLLSGNDTFIGSSTANINDDVQSLDGNDSFTGYGDATWTDGSVGDQFYGGNGIDTAVYRGVSTQYNINQQSSISDLRNQSYKSIAATSVTDQISNRDGLDNLVSVERLHFSDTNIAFDTGAGQNAGMAYRMYRAALDRTPDKIGLGGWIKVLDDGASLDSVASGFINSTEFQGKYGTNPSAETFVKLLYQNVLHRAPDAPGLQGWTHLLETGYTKEQVLIGFSESPENIQQAAQVIGNGLQYQEWIG